MQDTLINPTVIIEVLSPSTERYDRGMKFQHYRLVEAVQDYLLIAQDQRRIEHFVRQKAGLWLLQEVTDAEQKVVIDSIVCSLSLDDVYEKVELPPPDAELTRDTPQE